MFECIYRSTDVHFLHHNNIFSLNAVSLCLSRSFLHIERPLSHLCLIGSCCCCCSYYMRCDILIFNIYCGHRCCTWHHEMWIVGIGRFSNPNRRKSNRKPHVLCLPYFMLTSCFSFVSFDFCASFRLIITYLFGNERPQKDIWNWINTGVGEQSEERERPIIWYI